MWVRLVLLLTIITGLSLAFRRLRSRPALPLRWRLLAARSPVMREALRIRRSMAGMLRKGHGLAASGLLGDVDMLLEALARAVEIRDQAEQLPHAEESVRAASEQVRDAMAQLEKAHMTLLDSARAEVDGSVREIRHELAEHTERLRLSVEAQKDLERELRQKDEQS